MPSLPNWRQSTATTVTSGTSSSPSISGAMYRSALGGGTTPWLGLRRPWPLTAALATVATSPCIRATLGWVHRSCGDYQQALANGRQAVTLAEELGQAE